MENYITAELTYIIDDGQPSIRYVDWPEEEHKAHIAAYEKRTTQIFTADTPGPTRVNIAKVNYEKLERPIHPLDKI